MDWSFQLYSARKFEPWEHVLETLARLGYKRVEGYGGVYGNPEAFRAELDKNHLTMPSGHFGFDLLEKDFPNALKVARTLGVELVACPHLQADERPKDADGWRDFGRRLGAIGEKVTAEGMDFAWHNHDFEFAALPDGSLPMTHILEAAPELGWEIDVAWVIKGGASVEVWVDKYADRIKAVHVKDIARDGENKDEDGWADVGHGTVDWSALLKRFADTPAKLYVMEQDNPNDFERFARRSIETVNAY
jgi:sugar phosphate isomerase/epimerase